MLGEAFLAEEAREMGLVNKVLPVAELMAYAQAQCTKLVNLPAASIRTTKKLMRTELRQLAEATMKEEMQHFGRMLHAPEAKEAFTAFFEKRKPDFKQFA